MKNSESAAQAKPIIISGGGIAGLTAALSLAKYGFAVEVHEKSEGFDPIGAGLQISPNAYKILDDLGLTSKLSQACTKPNAISVRNAVSGKPITEIPLGSFCTKRYGAPYMVIHRADLQDILFEKCSKNKNIKIHFSSEVIDFAQHFNGVTVLVSNHNRTDEIIGQAMVIADGVHSKLRNIFEWGEKPEFQNKIAWRALIAANEVPKSFSLHNTGLWLGPNAHVVTYPMRQAKFLNVVAISHSKADEKLSEQSKERVAEIFAKWPSQFKELFNSKAKWTGWPLYATQKLENMVEQNVAMIGDAAHSMLPFSAQGAAMAIEDAAVLAQQIAEHQTISEALTNFETLRIPRVNKVMDIARKNGEIYHLKGLSAIARNFAMQLAPKSRLLARQDWIYNWEVSN